jgi:ubiquinone/menaquinone biosynthesis C-methylase UbiE
MSERNKNTYNAPDVVHWYDGLNEITTVEKKIFENYASTLQNGTILDIGIGGGRTTAFLLPKSSSYTGIDLSEAFVEVCRKKFSTANIRLMDARDLSAFRDDTFDLVNFSFNGIDYVDLAGREKILSEIYRVLRPEGIFFFSTHNMSHETFNTPPWSRKKESFQYNLKTFLKLSPFLWRKFMNKSSESFEKDHAIVNDHAHNYRLLTFYSSPDHIRKQLNVTGFKKLSFYNREGIICTDKDLDDWIFITCQK